MTLQKKDVEYLGSNWGVRWYWDKVSQKYYSSPITGNAYADSQLYEVTNASDLKKLEVEYPRGDNAFDDSDYNPKVEGDVVKLNDYGAAVDLSLIHI